MKPTKEEINIKSIQNENNNLFKTIFKTSPKRWNTNLNSPKSTQQISNVNRQLNFQYDPSERNNQNINEFHEGDSKNMTIGSSYLNHKNTRNVKMTNLKTNMLSSGSKRNSTNLLNNDLAKTENSNKFNNNCDKTEIGEKRKLVILIPDDFNSSIEIMKVPSSSSTKFNLIEKIDVLKLNCNDWIYKPEVTLNAAPSSSAESSSSYKIQQSSNSIGPIKRRKKNKKSRNIPYNPHRQDQQNFPHINRHETESERYRSQHQVTVNAKFNDVALPNVTITYAVENREQVLSSSGPIRNRQTRNRNKQRSDCPYQININPVYNTPNHVDATPRTHRTFRYNSKTRLCWKCKSDSHIYINCPLRVSRTLF